MTPITNILRQATRKENENLHIITFPTHERYQSHFAALPHTFWMLRGRNVKGWDSAYAPLPPNHILLNESRYQHQLPPIGGYDLILSQNKFGQFQWAKELSIKMHLPLVCIEHTQPMPNWNSAMLSELKQMKGHINLFISEFSRKEWGWLPEEAEVIHHCVDIEQFEPSIKVKKKKHVLSVCNDFINRDLPCGFRLWKEVTNKLPKVVVGKTPGLSEPAKDIDELTKFYQEASVFLNTSQYSPIPTVLLEAMACGTACVSTANGMIPEIIKDGENGLLGNSVEELRSHCEDLLKDERRCAELGKNARKIILEKFGKENFLNKWEDVFKRAANTIYLHH